jgi:uncharacterized protein (TIGR02246 family)
MNTHLRWIRWLGLVALCGLPAVVVAASPVLLHEEQAIKAVLARFYEGWNAHDVDRMVSVYSDDLDHTNVFAEWHKGKPAITEALKHFHAGPAKNSHKTYTIEKIRFVKPDVAIVQVRSLSTVRNLGTYVMTRQSAKWLVVSFTNVSYGLSPAQ